MGGTQHVSDSSGHGFPAQGGQAAKQSSPWAHAAPSTRRPKEAVDAVLQAAAPSVRWGFLLELFLPLHPPPILLPMGRRQCALCRTWIEATALSPKEGDFARCKTVDTTPWTRTRTGEGESVCCGRQAARGPWMDGASPLLHHPDACGATAAWVGGVGCDRMHHPLVVTRVLGLSDGWDML